MRGKMAEQTTGLLQVSFVYFAISVCVVSSSLCSPMITPEYVNVMLFCAVYHSVIIAHIFFLIIGNNMTT